MVVGTGPEAVPEVVPEVVPETVPGAELFLVPGSKLAESVVRSELTHFYLEVREDPEDLFGILHVEVETEVAEVAEHQQVIERYSTAPENGS